MPADIRPPPGSTHLHYPDAFDPEMTFQLRERNTATLEEMKKVVVDVEANLLNRKAKLTTQEKARTEKKRMTYSEVKIDVLANTMEEMMQKISIREKLDVQRHHVPLISEKEKAIVPKHFAAHPWYHGLDNDSFMYSIHDVVKDEAPSQLAEEQPADMMCMFDDIPYLDNLPKCDQYDDHEAEIDVDCSKQSTTCRWQENDQLQLRYDNQPLHNNHDSDEENAENIRVSGNTLPLCFSSFQFLKRNSRPVVNSEDKKFSDQSVEDAIVYMEVDPKVQPLSLFEGQTSDEIMKPETSDELIHLDSLPLCFNSFQILRGNLGQILVESHSVSHEVPVEPMAPLSKAFYDPIADVLDDLCCQIHFPSSIYRLKRCYDIDMIRQSTTGTCSVEVSFQNPPEHLQPYQEVHEDANNITTTSNHEVELVKFEYPVIGQVYLDPVAIYMEKFCIAEPQSISGITFVLQDCQGLRCKDQSCF
jgi:hypothetical protein